MAVYLQQQPPHQQQHQQNQPRYDHDNMLLDWGRVGLIGRAKEINVISTCIDGAVGNNSMNQESLLSSLPSTASMLLVHGYSGTGKSAVVQEAIDQCHHNNRDGGREFIAAFGKYEMSSGSPTNSTIEFAITSSGSETRPFGAILDASEDLCRSILLTSTSLSSCTNEQYQQESYVKPSITDELAECLRLTFTEMELTLLSQFVVGVDAILSHHHDHEHSEQFGQKTSKMDHSYSTAQTSVASSTDFCDSINGIDSVDSFHDAMIQEATAVNNNETTLIRFMSIFRRFLNVVSYFVSFVFVLDDLQWVDDASRKLLNTVLYDDALTGFLIIGVIRDGETTTFTPPSNAKLTYHSIQIPALTQDGVNDLIAAVTNVYHNSSANHYDVQNNFHHDDVEELGAVVFNRTSGNPHFVRRYLDHLQYRGILCFDKTEQSFVWDLRALHDHSNDRSSGVVDLMTNLIRTKSQCTQIVLAVAAMMGHTFSQAIISKLLAPKNSIVAHFRDMMNKNDGRISSKLGVNSMGIPPQRVAQILKACSSMGLLVSIRAYGKQQKGFTMFRFVHDGVQQGAYQNLICSNTFEGRRLLSLLGRCFLKVINNKFSTKISSTTTSNISSMLYKATSLVIKYTTPDEMSRDKVAKICLCSANHAARQAAFKSAARFADAGLEMLGPRAWTDHYQLGIQLCSIAAEMHLSDANLEVSRNRAYTIHNNAKTNKDEYRAYCVLLDAYFIEGKFADCIREGVTGLNALSDTRFPTRVTAVTVAKHLLRTKHKLKGRRGIDIEKLPDSNDAVYIARSELMGKIGLAAWMEGKEQLFTVCNLMGMQDMLQNGISAQSPFTIALYGICLAYIGNMKEAYEFGMAAVNIANRPGMDVAVCRAHNGVEFFLRFLSDRVSKCLTETNGAIDMALKMGDPCHAGAMMRGVGPLGLLAGKTLDFCEQQFHMLCSMLTEYKQLGHLNSVEPWAQLVENLQGKANHPLILEGKYISADRAAAAREYVKSKGSIKGRGIEAQREAQCMNYTQTIIYCVLGEYAAGELERKRCKQIPGEMSTCYQKMFHYTFCGMNSYGLAIQLNKPRYAKPAKTYVTKLKKMGTAGSPDIAAMLLLLGAEQDRLYKRNSEATDKYLAAIEEFRAGKLMILEALAYERLGSMLLKKNQKQLRQQEVATTTKMAPSIVDADRALKESYSIFREYGASVKLDQMKRWYPTVRFVEGK